MSRDPGPIPQRWLHCPRKSDSIIADRFIAFKTPLKSEFQSKMPLQCSFTPSMLLDLMKRQKQRVGLWIDLTNTNRFYDKHEIMDAGSQYIKLKCRGHGETPTLEHVSSFIEIVEEFVREHPMEVIGVHCTHGFNRTGFMIVSYMVERLDCSVDAAVMAFAKARPPGIYKADYLRELFTRYGDVEDTPPPPQLPDWCLEYDDGDKANNQEEEDDDAGDGNDGNGNSARGSKRSHDGENGPTPKRSKRASYNPNAVFMEDVPNVTLVRDEALIATLQERVKAMCGSKLQGFAGAQPVSMDRHNIRYLREMPYRVSWKADGTRYMMLIRREGEIYFFDRDNSVFKAEGIRFPTLSNPSVHLSDTLVDGEMVLDKYGDAQKIPRYLIYDVIYMQNRDVRKQHFHPDRLNLIEEIIRARTAALKQGKLDRASEPFGVRKKEFWDITQARALLGPKFTKNLGHEPDGLIFQPSIDPYESGVCPRVLKWKPHHMNSIDFRLVIKEQNQKGMLPCKIGLLYVGGMEQCYSQIKLTKELRKLNNKIIECKFDRNEWVLMRERTDKSFPNSYETAKNVWESIRFPVTEELLLKLIDEERYRSDTDLMPPPRLH